MSASHFRLACALLAAALPAARAAHLTLRQDAATHTISVYRDNVPAPILTQNAKPDFRPYLHPIVSPDGKSVLTEFSPGHHKHQTGIYWGLTRANGDRFRQYVLGIGGTLIYLVDEASREAMWASEFPVALDGPAPAAEPCTAK